MASEHDKRYKKLFSHPYFLQKLLESFVHEEFISRLDFSTLKRLDKSFISDEYVEKESDLIFSIHFRNKPIYIFLLIEFQSTVDKMMPIRFLRYICEFYTSLHKKANSELFPAVFPVLLYNGDAKWTADLQINEMIELSIPDKYIPKFEYYPILENEIPKSSLLRIKNAVSAVFYMENLDDQKLSEEIDRIIEIITDEELEIVREFALFFNNFLGSKADIESARELNRKIDNVMEVKTMLATTIKRIKEQGIEQGIEKEKIIVAKNMKEKGLDENLISEITGLSKEIIETL